MQYFVDNRIILNAYTNLLNFIALKSKVQLMQLLLTHLSENHKSLNKNFVQKLFFTAIERNDLEVMKLFIDYANEKKYHSRN